MKRLIILLLSIIVLQVQGQSIKVGDTTYFPRVSDNSQVLRQVGFAVITPTNYNPTKQYPVKQIVHGVGERSEGKLEHLRNLTQGAVYTKGGPRLYPFMTPDLAKAINDSQFIAVIPTYADQFQPSDINFVFDEVIRNFSVDQSRLALVGFSYGGGAVTRYVTSYLANAQRIALAVACAPVNWATNYSYVRDAELSVIVITATTDDKVNPINGKNFADGINALNPKIKAKLIVLPYSGHAGLTEMLEIYNKYIPQNMYGFLKQITNTTPKQYPTTTTTSPPPVTQPPATNLTAKAKEIGVTSIADIKLDGTASTGWTGASWGLISVPAGVNIYSKVITGGAGWITGTATLPKEGAYMFVLNAYTASQSARDTIVVTYQKTTIPVPVVPYTYDSATGYLVLSDGTRLLATATVDFTTKKVTVKDQAGITYTW
jgi:dienelactone hydrolase